MVQYKAWLLEKKLEWVQSGLFGRSQPASSSQAAILSGLNPRQKEAVWCTNARLIITAGPGTGKTRTLTHRLAYLIAAQGVSPTNILAITFTNKAAAEMAHRLANLVGCARNPRPIPAAFPLDFGG